jgi:hypothetical protein
MRGIIFCCLLALVWGRDETGTESEGREDALGFGINSLGKEDGVQFESNLSQDTLEYTVSAKGLLEVTKRLKQELKKAFQRALDETYLEMKETQSFEPLTPQKVLEKLEKMLNVDPIDWDSVINYIRIVLMDVSGERLHQLYQDILHLIFKLKNLGPEGVKLLRELLKRLIHGKGLGNTWSDRETLYDQLIPVLEETRIKVEHILGFLDWVRESIRIELQKINL